MGSASLPRSRWALICAAGSAWLLLVALSGASCGEAFKAAETSAKGGGGPSAGGSGGSIITGGGNGGSIVTNGGSGGTVVTSGGSAGAAGLGATGGHGGSAGSGGSSGSGGQGGQCTNQSNGVNCQNGQVCGPQHLCCGWGVGVGGAPATISCVTTTTCPPSWQQMLCDGPEDCACEGTCCINLADATVLSSCNPGGCAPISQVCHGDADCADQNHKYCCPVLGSYLRHCIGAPC